MSSDTEKFEVIFLPHGRRDTFKSGTRLLDASQALAIDLASDCGGKGTCGKCKVRIDEGYDSLGKIKPSEEKHLTKDMIDKGYRLACLAKIRAPLKVYVPEISRVGKQRLQTEGLEVPVTANPFVRKYFVKIPVPSLHDVRADEDRLLDTLKEQHNLDPNTLVMEFDIANDFPNIAREAEWQITATVWKENNANYKIIAIEPGDTSNRCFGFACDIGSTKLAGFLIDLNTGKVQSVGSRMNPQTPMGEDVLSRITSVMMGGKEAQDRIHNLVVGGINEIIEECCEKAKVSTNEIYELCFVGNTAMQMLFLRLWPQYTAFSPYPPVLRRGVNVPAPKIDLKSNPHGNCYFVPVIGGFVGADQIAVIQATRMLERDEITMDVDIGTNTEIALGNKDLVMCDSCASGPAFEGMEIKFGMRAATGAIEAVTINPSGLELIIRTIEDQPAVGICGSALIDIPAELLKSGLIDLKGKFVSKMAKQTERLRKGPEGWEYMIASKEESATEHDIVITQGDVRELQKAKAAMHTGAELMLRRMGMTEKDITKLWLAGAFGNYINPENARTIGMYPELPTEKYVFVGNAAGTGARMSLISQEEREYVEKISKTVVYYELATDEQFQSEYALANYFPYKNLDKYPLTKDLLLRLGRIDENGKFIYPE